MTNDHKPSGPAQTSSPAGSHASQQSYSSGIASSPAYSTGTENLLKTNEFPSSATPSALTDYDSQNPPYAPRLTPSEEGARDPYRPIDHQVTYKDRWGTAYPPLPITQHDPTKPRGRPKRSQEYVELDQQRFQYFASQLQDLLTEHDISIGALASASGINAPQLHRALKGKGLPYDRVDDLHTGLERYNITIEPWRLYTWMGETPPEYKANPKQLEHLIQSDKHPTPFRPGTTPWEQPEWANLTTGQRIKQLRTALGDTQTTFAERVGGLSRVTIAFYEAGRASPRPSTARGIERRLGMWPGSLVPY